MEIYFRDALLSFLFKLFWGKGNCEFGNLVDPCLLKAVLICV